jgi:hypothetical protein
VTVENPSGIDGMGIDKVSGEIVLTVSDHLAWSEDNEHLETLQAKLNSYLEFIQSGQVYEESRKDPGTPVRIDVVGKYAVPDSVQWFFEKVDEIADQVGATVTYQQIPNGY